MPKDPRPIRKSQGAQQSFQYFINIRAGEDQGDGDEVEKQSEVVQNDAEIDRGVKGYFLEITKTRENINEHPVQEGYRIDEEDEWWLGQESVENWASGREKWVEEWDSEEIRRCLDWEC